MRASTRFRHVRLLSAVTAAVFAASLTASPSGPNGGGFAGDDPLAAGANGVVPTRGVEPYAVRDPQTDCEMVELPGVQAFRDVVLAAYPGSADGGIVRECSIGGRSEHKEGRAWDWMLDAADPEDAAAADEVLAWLLATDEQGEPHAVARRLGVMYIIWDGEIWSATKADAGWRPYDGVSPHTDHVHVSFSRAGADATTSFFDDVWDAEVGATFPALAPADGVEVAAAAFGG